MISDNLKNISSKLPSGVQLVAVSKFHPVEAIEEALAAGHNVFAESRPQELEKKASALEGKDIEWHFIGHLQTNKLKMVLPYVNLVQSVDSLHLLQDIDKWGKTNGKKVNVLLEMHIASEETKQGFGEDEILDILFNSDNYRNINFCGLMGMATNTDEIETIEADFSRISSWFDYLKDLFPEMESFRVLSIGMSSDWQIAVRYGATMVRIGTAIFGDRNYD